MEMTSITTNKGQSMRQAFPTNAAWLLRQHNGWTFAKRDIYAANGDRRQFVDNENAWADACNCGSGMTFEACCL